ncbi:MAG: hypothetical protein AAGC67_20245, partial [Myxococcota bacterium]
MMRFSPRSLRPATAVAFLLLTLVPLSAKSELVTFTITPTLSSGDLELTGLVNVAFLPPEAEVGPGINGFVFATNSVSDSAPISGTLVLDVTMSGATVTAVDFVSLNVDYDVTLASTFEWMFNYRPGILGTDGTETVRLVSPFDQAVASGNMITPTDPAFELLAIDKGTETGTGGDLDLEGSFFTFEGTAQYFDDQGPLPASDGFPSELGPFPTLLDFEGAPTGPNTLVGTVVNGPAGLAFSGTYFFYGVGGIGGGLRSGEVHSGSLFAAPEPGFAIGLLVGGGLLTASGRRR